MRLKSVFILIAAVAIGLTAYFYATNNKFKTAITNSELVPGLQDELNNVTKFTVTEAGNSLLSSVSKTADGWVVDNRDGYPANVAAVRYVFGKLAEAKLTEAKTSNPANYTKLGVEGVDNEKAQGVLLTVEGLEDVVNIIFGNDGTSGKNTQYIRSQSEEQSWLINKKINVARDVTDWLEKDILDIPPERIKSISIQHTNGETININNTGNAAYEFDLDATAPEGKKISDSEIYQVANALSSLQLKDVAKSPGKDSANAITAVFKTYDGLTITSIAYPSAIESSFTLGIEFNEEDVDHEAIKNTSDSEKPTDAAMSSNPETAKKLAESLKPRLEGWLYNFPTITQTALTKKLDDFFIDEDA